MPLHTIPSPYSSASSIIIYYTGIPVCWMIFYIMKLFYTLKEVFRMMTYLCTRTWAIFLCIHFTQRQIFVRRSLYYVNGCLGYDNVPSIMNALTMRSVCDTRHHFCTRRHMSSTCNCRRTMYNEMISDSHCHPDSVTGRLILLLFTSAMSPRPMIWYCKHYRSVCRTLNGNC